MQEDELTDRVADTEAHGLELDPDASEHLAEMHCLPSEIGTGKAQARAAIFWASSDRKRGLWEVVHAHFPCVLIASATEGAAPGRALDPPRRDDSHLAWGLPVTEAAH